ncbi:hypothetical protein NL676_028923 [Syzygium grande]|nr:hypothetical protein NL676_028923 [Syzygium grande]
METLERRKVEELRRGGPAARAGYGGAQWQIGGGGNKNRGSSNGNRRVVDDDDDSDIEMLSILSGDEDSAKDCVGSRARGGVSGGSGPGMDETKRGMAKNLIAGGAGTKTSAVFPSSEPELVLNLYLYYEKIDLTRICMVDALGTRRRFHGVKQS